MPLIRLKDQCQAVADEIEAATRDDAWTGAIVSATRKYLHQFALEDADNFLATVAPEERDSQDADRVRDQIDSRLRITFSKRVANTEAGTVDPLVDTVEMLQDFFEDKHALTGLKNCWCWGTEVALFDTFRLHTESFFWAELVIVVRLIQ